VPSIRLGSAPTTLPTGKLQLAGGVTAMLTDATSATARFQQGTLDIALASGTIVLHVLPREIGQAVLITAGPHRFTVVGTVFRLSYTARRLDLSVIEGLVAVSRGGDHVATVASGETWSVNPVLLALPAPASPRHGDAAPRVARRTEDCARFTAEQTQQKIACYREQVSKGGRDGERAQHMLARYLRDDVVDLTGALAAFESQRARYPRGELRVEADRAVIEILPRLGRHAEALVETQSFLDAHPDAEDRAELRLMRGDIFRAIFQDMLSAEREYDEGADADGRTGDDSRFLRALCLESLGRVDEARLAYRDYLAQAGTAHAREAQRHMKRLAQ
jgi:tetratricopeptide (TPR) repeat protein